MEVTFSIIGTAGRKDDGKKLSLPHFNAMCIIASELIDQLSDTSYKITQVVSGGAAWADHVAIKLFLDKKVPKLRLYFPCEWNNGNFKEIQYKDAGSTANYYHKQFQIATHINSLSQIQTAINRGAEISCHNGFHARNSFVAKSDFLLACTFGEENKVKDGGTAHTVETYLDRVRKEGFFNKSWHYNLSDGKLYEGCEVQDKNESAPENLRRLRKNGRTIKLFNNNASIVSNV